MQSNIDGMMANYDQVSAEREELLESLADVRMIHTTTSFSLIITLCAKMHAYAHMQI